MESTANNITEVIPPINRQLHKSQIDFYKALKYIPYMKSQKIGK